MQKCSTCKFIDGLYCRRYPPAVDNGASVYPMVLGNQWCGEYQPNAEIRQEIEDENLRALLEILFLPLKLNNFQILCGMDCLLG